MPEELYLKDAELLNETDEELTVGVNAPMNVTGLFGGMAFGIH